MTPERAKWLLDNQTEYGFKWAFESPLAQKPFYTGTVKVTGEIDHQGITPDEFEFVSLIWQMMGQTKSFYHAVVEVSNL